MLKRYIDLCLKCICNESDIDMFLTPVEYRGTNFFPNIPRVSRWIVYWEKRKLTFLLGYYTLVIVWFLGAGVLYFLTKHVMYLCNKLCGRKFVDDTLEKKNVVVFLENNTAEYIKEATKKHTPLVWLIPPKYKKECERVFSEQDLYIDVESIVSLKDILFSFFVCVYVLYRYAVISKLQVYTMPDCLLTSLALEKLNVGTLTCTAHFDRWAVMVNEFCEKKSINYQFVQHGSIKGITAKSNQHYYVTNKLTAVRQLVVYDDIEASLILKNIVAPENKPVCIYYIKPRFTLSASLTGDILFIGHPLYENLHIAIYNSLSEENLEVYYKPHPKAQSSGKIIGVGWHFINDVKTFPSVKYVISYHSTLALMYEEIGVKVFIHENEAINSFDYVSFICKIRESLRHHDYH